MERKSGELLWRIKEIANCFYLSDLCFACLSESEKAEIIAIPESLYSLPEWNEAISYITRQKCSVLTVGIAKKMITG